MNCEALGGRCPLEPKWKVPMYGEPRAALLVR
jgi:hypothetical protein